ncbi:T9SS type A sorting domain-containing protein [Labilibacter marinus]|uniref:T9SS type A sorting domain-containing protein n=1 Tax=Labilibacter marinus TaxID=1477105 RepID=UPI00082D5235|nr:T9SS type A sorting domain-containing protein [Labilibacter marinus]
MNYNQTFRIYTKRVFSILILSISLQTTATFAGNFADQSNNYGNGTEGDPYQIADLADLHYLSKNHSFWKEHFILTADIDAAETETNPDYNNGGSGFSPIGIGNNPFYGTFNGNGHIISNLYIKSDDDILGLFGEVYLKSTIENLGIVNPKIIGGEYKSNSVGALIGFAYGYNERVATVRNCFVTGGSITGDENIGGVVGHARGVNISNCYSSTNVSGTRYIGGVVGMASLDLTMSNCYSSSQVTAYQYSGALIGVAGSYGMDVSDCFWDSETSGVSTAGAIPRNADKSKDINTSGFVRKSNFPTWDFENIWKIGKNAWDDTFRPRLNYESITEYTYVKTKKATDIRIYPTSTKDYFWLEGKDLIGSYISIYDLSGIPVFKSSEINSEYQYNISSLNKGIYIVVISRNNYILSSQKIIKK